MVVGSNVLLLPVCEAAKLSVVGTWLDLRTLVVGGVEVLYV